MVAPGKQPNYTPGADVIPDKEADDYLDAIATRDSRPAANVTTRRPYLWTCLNCGKPFRAPPSSKSRTCSKECSRRHRSRKHLDISNAWTDTGAARVAAERTSNLLLGTHAARESRKAGPFETNINAKRWVVIDPTGVRHEARNLRLWCERNADSFAPHTWQAAYAGLRQVAAWLRGKTSRTVSRWRGWSIGDLPEER